MSIDSVHLGRDRDAGGSVALGQLVLQIAESLLGCHYVNGAYGAFPMADKKSD